MASLLQCKVVGCENLEFLLSVIVCLLSPVCLLLVKQDFIDGTHFVEIHHIAYFNLVSLK